MSETNGPRFFGEAGPPSAEVGKPGDYYADTKEKIMWARCSLGWVDPVSFDPLPHHRRPPYDGGTFYEWKSQYIMEILNSEKKDWAAGGGDE